MILLRLLSLAVMMLAAPLLPAQQGPETGKPAPAPASLEQRVGDLEAYVTNAGPRAGDDKAAAG
ncbi:MAG: hypothetical protein ACO3ND_04885, partial [Opitutales bacterium]